LWILATQAGMAALDPARHVEAWLLKSAGVPATPPHRLVPGVAFSLVVAVANAWVLLVEVVR
jgi:hypothetical protein